MRTSKALLNILISLIFISAQGALANDQPQSLTFKAWKEQQILSAQNRLLRLNAELEVAKNSKDSKEAGGAQASKKEKAFKRFHRSQTKTSLERLENEVKLAKNTVQVATELTFDDYIAVYLPTLTESPEVIEALLDTLTREELSLILREVLKKQSDQRDKASAGGGKLSGVWLGQTDPVR